MKKHNHSNETLFTMAALLLPTAPNLANASEPPAAEQKNDSDEQREIIVRAKPAENASLDSTSYKIVQTPEVQTLTAIDLISRIPLVEVNPNGSIRLLGASGVKILVDGRDIPDAQTFVKSLPGSSIERIEISTSPSVRFPSATGGIINIILRKSFDKGISGVAVATASQFGTSEIRLAPTYSRGPLSISTTLNLAHGNVLSDSERFQFSPSSNISETYSSNDREKSRVTANTYTINLIANYLLPSNNAITGTVFRNDTRSRELEQTFHVDTKNGESVYQSRQNLSLASTNLSFEFSNQLTSIDFRKLSISYSNVSLGMRYTGGISVTVPSPNQLFGTFDSNDESYNAKADFGFPLTSSLSSSFGGKFERRYLDTEQAYVTVSPINLQPITVSSRVNAESEKLDGYASLRWVHGNL